jgi:exopolyphosphatase/guanosine-5'-triphosphate,3'-diphosphate pyrophosphatase
MSQAKNIKANTPEDSKNTTPLEAEASTTKHVAAIDLGSNSFHMVVAKFI